MITLYLLGVLSHFQCLKSLSRQTGREIDPMPSALIVLTWPVSMPFIFLVEFMRGK